MAAGKREHYVKIEKSAETQLVGEPVVVWTTHARWWAEKLPLGGSEGPAGGQVQYATARNQWNGLWIDGVTPKMRLNDNGTLFDIDLVDDTGRRQNILRLVTTQRDVA